MNTRERIARYIVEEFLPDTPADAIPDDLNLIESGVVDSLGLLKIVAFLEEDLGLSIAPEAMVPEHLSSIEALCALVEGQVLAVD